MRARRLFGLVGLILSKLPSFWNFKKIKNRFLALLLRKPWKPVDLGPCLRNWSRELAAIFRWLRCTSCCPPPRLTRCIPSLASPGVCACCLCPRQTFLKAFPSRFINLSRECHFAVREDNRCLPLIGSIQCPNIFPVAFLVCTQKFASFSILFLRSPRSVASTLGTITRSAFLKCSVKCPEKLLTVVVTAPPLIWIVLMTVSYRLESLWSVYF